MKQRFLFDPINDWLTYGFSAYGRNPSDAEEALVLIQGIDQKLITANSQPNLENAYQILNSLYPSFNFRTATLQQAYDFIDSVNNNPIFNIKGYVEGGLVPVAAVEQKNAQIAIEEQQKKNESGIVIPPLNTPSSMQTVENAKPQVEPEKQPVTSLITPEIPVVTPVIPTVVTPVIPTVVSPVIPTVVSPVVPVITKPDVYIVPSEKVASLPAVSAKESVPYEAPKPILEIPKTPEIPTVTTSKVQTSLITKPIEETNGIDLSQSVVSGKQYEMVVTVEDTGLIVMRTVASILGSSSASKILSEYANTKTKIPFIDLGKDIQIDYFQEFPNFDAQNKVASYDWTIRFTVLENPLGLDDILIGIGALVGVALIYMTVKSFKEVATVTAELPAVAIDSTSKAVSDNFPVIFAAAVIGLVIWKSLH